MYNYIRYERQVGLGLARLITVKVQKDNTGKTVRVTELGPVTHKTPVSDMTSVELLGWGSCKHLSVITREMLISFGYVTPGVYIDEPYLPLEAWAIKSHIDDTRRVEAGGQPTSCNGEGSDCNPSDEEYMNTIYDQWYESRYTC